MNREIDAASARRPLWGEIALFLPFWTAHAVLVRRFWFVTDDAYISFRYARNLLRGLGPCFNPADRPPVEGYSNFLWMLLCAGFEALGWNPETATCVASFACSTALLWLVWRALRLRLGLGLGAAAPALALLALAPPMAVYATSGLETMAYALLVWIALDRLVLAPWRPRGPLDAAVPWVAGALALLAMALIRVEGIYWALVLLGAAWVARRLRGRPHHPLGIRGDPLWQALLLTAAGYGLYWAWRYWVYRLPFSNTVYAKAALDLPRLARGIDYVVATVLALGTPLLLLPAAVRAFVRERRAAALPLAAVALGFHAYAALVSGDFMAFGRFLLPALPPTAVLVGWLWADLAGRGAARRAAVAAAGLLVAGAGVLPAFDRSVFPAAWVERFDFRREEGDERARTRSEFRQWRFQKENAERWAAVGRALAYWLEDDATVVRHTIGAVGWYSDLYLFDGHGLVTREVTALPPEKRLGPPGHDRSVPPLFFLPHAPDVLRPTIVSGLPRWEPGQDEASARGLFAENLARFYGDGLREEGVDDRYVPDFLAVPEHEPGGPRPLLILQRRIPPGTSPEAAWADFETRLELYRAGQLSLPGRFPGYPARP